MDTTANPLVQIFLGSASDREMAEHTSARLDEFGIPYRVTVSSAHRSPERTSRLAMTAERRGVKVIIAMAGGAAHLAGVIAAHTVLPVIAVPLASTPLAGFDALLSSVQMPPGVPAPGIETCLAVQPPDGGDVSVLLCERADNQAGTRCYTLRTVRQEFTRMAAFLFADAIKPGEAFRAQADQNFRFGQNSLRIQNVFVRSGGEEAAMGRVTMHAPKRRNEEPLYIKVSRSELIDVMTKRFIESAARTQ